MSAESHCFSNVLLASSHDSIAADDELLLNDFDSARAENIEPIGIFVFTQDDFAEFILLHFDEIRKWDQRHRIHALITHAQHR